MLVAKPSVDLSEVRKNWNDWVAEAGAKFDEALGEGAKGPGTIGAGTAAISAGLKKIADEAKRTSDATQSLADRLKLDKAVGAIGPLKDAYGMVSESLLGVSKEASAASVKTLELAEKFAQMGSVLGPWGAAAGAAAGIIAGPFANAAEHAKQKLKDLDDATKRTEEAQRGLVTQIRLLREQLGAVDGSNLSGAMQRFDLVGAQIKEAKDKLSEFQAAQDKLFAKMSKDRLTETAYSEENRKERQRVTEGIEQQEKKIKELEKVQADAATGLRTTSAESVAAQAKGIKTLSDMTAAELKKEKETQKARYEAAKGEAEQIKKRISLSGEDTAETRENAEAAAKNNKILTEAKEKYDAASGALTNLTNKKKDLTFAEAAARVSAEQDAEMRSGAFAQEQRWQQEADALELGMDTLAVEETEKTRQQQIKIDQIQSRWHEQRLTALEKFYKSQQQIIDEGERRKADAIQMAADATNSVIDSAAQTILTAFGDTAVKGINKFYDAIANRERQSKEDRKRNRVEWMRDTGTKLMVDGEGHVIAGTVNAIAGRPGGKAEVVAGLAEIGIGAAMGGIGALGQRRLGGTAEKVGREATPEKGSANSLGGSDGTQQRPPIVINFNSPVPATQRGAQEQAKAIADLLHRRRT